MKADDYNVHKYAMRQWWEMTVEQEQIISTTISAVTLIISIRAVDGQLERESARMNICVSNESNLICRHNLD